jgi:predicted dehydrogenase
MTILIVGVGSIAQKHFNALKTLVPDCTIYALRSSVNAASVDGVISIYSWDEILEKPDFVIISNPTRFHGEAILKALAYKCPLFIEKPALSHLDEAEQILSLIKQQNAITYVACNLRFHPVIQYLKKRVSSQLLSINEVNVYCGSYLPDWRANRDYTTTYSANKELGGGVHLDLIHELDYCYWLFGNPVHSFNLKRKVSVLQIDSCDAAIYNLVYPSFTANIVLNYFRRDTKRSIEIVTDNESLYADLIKNTVTNHRSETLFESDSTVAQTYIAQMKYFLDLIAGNEESMNDMDEAFKVLQIALKSSCC